MENLNENISSVPKEKKILFKMGTALLFVLAIFYIIRIVSEIKSYGFIGSDVPPMTSISFDGKGEVYAIPDVANIYFTVREESKTMKEAQDKVATKTKSALDFIKASGVADKDVKTQNYNAYPKYETKYENALPCINSNCPPPQGKQIISGYEISQSISVKLRNTDDAGKILDSLAGVGVSDVQGPNFEVDDMDKLKLQAREAAIKDAQMKAEILSKALGVKLGRITGFYDQNNNYYPMTADYGMAKVTSMGGSEMIAPSLPTGESKVTAVVTITYETK